MGRLAKKFDKKQFENLCFIQCTLAEIQAVMELDTDTIEARCREFYGKSFSEVFNEKKGYGKVSLRRLQFQAAEKGNPAMLIFLGKNMLKQSDDVNVNLEAGVRIVIDDVRKDGNKD